MRYANPDATKENLLRILDEFLKDRRESDGGWAAITEEDMKLLGIILDFLIELKCERDPDGDVPIEYRLINRKICYLPYFGNMPYPHYESDEDPKRGKILMDYFRAAFFNLKIAMDEMDNANRYLQYEEDRRREARAAKKAKAGT